MARETKSTQFLKECMSDALIKLMAEKSLDKISITEITQLAGVGRSTWFRNFNSKSDALTYKLVQLWHRWADERQLSDVQRFKLGNATDFFYFNYNIRWLLELLYNAQMQSCIYDAFCAVMTPQYNTSALGCYQLRFYAYGVFGLLEEWFNRGFKESPDEMVELFYHVMDDRSTL